MKTRSRMQSLIRISATTMSHEWLPTLCLITALAAVICPVVVILGLKHGTVDNLRRELLRNPANLEIRPRVSLHVDDSLLGKIRNIPQAGFLIPKTRTLGSASVQFEKGEQSVDADLLPTGDGDPLLVAHQCQQPGNKEVVLTADAAKTLAVSRGDEIVMHLGRRALDGRNEKVSLSLEVRDVLPAEATMIKAGYVQLSLLAAVEQYRENLAVSEFGWTGPVTQRAEPVFDGVLVVCKEEIPAELKSRISIASNFLTQRRITDQETDPELRQAAANGGEAVLFFNDNQPQPESSVRQVASLLPGGEGRIIPWSKPRLISIIDSNSVSINYSLRCLMTALCDDSYAPILEQACIQIPTKVQASGIGRILARSPLGVHAFPCQLEGMAGFSEHGIAYAGPRLTGILRHLDTRSLEWNREQKCFLLGRREFSGFRLYARDLQGVEKLAEALTKMGIDCSSESDKVARVLKFDNDLSVLFWLICAFSLAGGAAALSLSLYGAIERRRRDYAMLRTLGLPRPWLIVLPLVEAMALTLLACTLALLVYHGIAGIINRLFVTLDKSSHGFCYLPLKLHAMVLLISFSVSICGVMASAIRLLSMKTFEAIRHD